MAAAVGNVNDCDSKKKEHETTNLETTQVNSENGWQPKYRIGRVNGSKEDGLIATCDIKAGELIFTENPILIQDSEIGAQQAYEIMKSKYQKWLDILPYRVPNDTTGDLSEYDKFKGQIDRCAFMRFKSDLDKTGTSVLYLKISKANHSCLPNASKTMKVVSNFAEIDNYFANDVFAFENRKEFTGIVAIRDIKKNDEITIFYDRCDTMFLPTNQRKELLKCKYEFDCDCERCNIDCLSGNALLFEKLLKAAKYPTNLKSNASKDEYLKEMKQEFDEIKSNFENVDYKLDDLSQYMTEFYQIISHTLPKIENDCCLFLEKYESKFLYSTHWRIIDIKRTLFYTHRRLTAVLKLFFAAQGKLDKKNMLLLDGMAQRLMLNLLSLMNSECEIIMKQLKYPMANDIIITEISMIDSLFDNWKAMLSNEMNGNHIAMKAKFCKLANEKESAMYYLVQSIKTLFLDERAKYLCVFANNDIMHEK